MQKILISAAIASSVTINAIAAPMTLSQMLSLHDSPSAPIQAPQPQAITQHQTPAYFQADLEEAERQLMLANTLSVVDKQKQIEALDLQIAAEKARIETAVAMANLNAFEQQNERFSGVDDTPAPNSSSNDGSLNFDEQLSLANMGDDVAQFNVAAMYFKGIAVKQDHKKAFEWYKRSASLGNPKAQFNIGLMLTYGDGVKMDIKTAALWYKRACDNGYSDGCQAYKLSTQPPLKPKTTKTKRR